jgi:hypothetical protein
MVLELSRRTVKVKFTLALTVNAQRGVETKLYSSFNLGARQAVDGQHQAPGHFTPG